ncbi:hypothetical protein MMC24_005471 [Lignoscripta atroalba]|nr:hypothetical protein [Lignoscripta atroalba]
MSASECLTESFAEPMTALQNFQNDYDLDNPAEAMSSYARVMHQHTKRQMDSATRSIRRRSVNDARSRSALTHESSSNSES